MANCTNLKLVDGGSEIKQGDFSSAFCFELLDENKKEIKGLDGKNAVVVLKRDDLVAFKKSVIVDENSVKFTIDKVLEAGVYLLEIFCDGYVFPSNNGYRITVVKSIFSDEILRSLRSDFDNTEDTGVILDESLKNFFVDGMSFKDFYDWFLDFREKFNGNYIFESESLAGFYYDKLDAIIHSNKSNLEDNMLDLVYSKSDRDSILFYYNKLKEIKVIEKHDEIISSITSIYVPNKDVFYTDGSYRLFSLPQNVESRDGNSYFAVKTRKLQSAIWSLENNDNVASIYKGAVLGEGMDFDFSFDGKSFKILENQVTEGICIVIKHDPRINQKGSFTVRAVTEDGETIDREFTVR